MGDDRDGIALNPDIKNLWSFKAPNDTTLAGRPIASFTFALNYALAPADVRDVMAPDPQTGDARFLTNVWGYHAFNLAVHLLAALLLFGIVRQTLLSPPLRDRFGEASSALAFSTALLWAVHPLQTESVTFLVQRVESLMGLFFLATLYCAIRAAESEFRNPIWTIAAIVACALGMGTKETMAGAPLFVALWLWVCRPDMKLLGPPRVLLAGLALTWVIPAWLFSSASRSLSVGFGLGGWTAWVYLRTQAEVIVHYLRLAFWPHPLVFHYAWLPVASWVSVLPHVLLLGSLGIASSIAIIRRRPVGLLGAWFFLILAPSSSIVPVVSEVAAEHRMYLPLAAVIVFVVLGVYLLARRIITNDESSSLVAGAGWTVLLAVALVFAWQTLDRNHAYASEEIMMADVANARPQNAQVQLADAMNLIRAQKYAEAEPHLRMAINSPLPPQIDPVVTATMHLNLGVVLCALGKYPECAEEMKRTVAIEPKFDSAYSMLGDVQLSLHQPREALEAFGRELALTPNSPRPLTRIAWILATSSDPAIRDGARAVKNAEQAATLTQGGDVSALDALAAAYAEVGRYEDAAQVVRRAINLIAADPTNPFTTVLQAHLGLLQQRRPIRTTEW